MNVARPGAGEQLDQPQLDRVRVLELVDHHVGEPLAPGLGERRARLEQLERAQLEVLEVERRALLLELGVARVRSPRAGARGPGATERAASSSAGVSARSSSLAAGRVDGIGDLRQARLAHPLAAQARVGARASSPSGATADRPPSARATSSSPEASRRVDRLRRRAVGEPRGLARVEHAEAGGRARRRADAGRAAAGRRRGSSSPRRARSPAPRAAARRRAAASPPARVARARAASSRRTRVRISAAARSVKVKARMRSTSTPSSATAAQ